MSHSIDDNYDIYHEHKIVARKTHTCAACGEPIHPGMRYCRVFILWEGEKSTVKRCDRCQELHEHLRDLAPGDMWPDEKLDCGDDYESEWGELPPEIAELAFLHPGELSARKTQGDKETKP